MSFCLPMLTDAMAAALTLTGFAMRLVGEDKVRVLQGGMEKWKAKGGFDAAAKVTVPARH